MKIDHHPSFLIFSLLLLGFMGTLLSFLNASSKSKAAAIGLHSL